MRWQAQQQRAERMGADGSPRRVREEVGEQRTTTTRFFLISVSVKINQILNLEDAVWQITRRKQHQIKSKTNKITSVVLRIYVIDLLVIDMNMINIKKIWWIWSIWFDIYNKIISLCKLSVKKQTSVNIYHVHGDETKDQNYVLIALHAKYLFSQRPIAVLANKIKFVSITVDLYLGKATRRTVCTYYSEQHISGKKLSYNKKLRTDLTLQLSRAVCIRWKEVILVRLNQIPDLR